MFRRVPKGPRLRRPWLEMAMIVLIVGLLVMLAMSLVPNARAQQDCVGEASTLRIAAELASRGFDRYGCWTEDAVLVRWEPAPDPAGDDWYELKVWAEGPLYSIERTYQLLSADSLKTWWPAGVTSLRSIVRAHDPDGASAWSDTSDVLVLN